MGQLSVVIITLNEEKNIGRCLDSVQDIADEIVVGDSFSTDQTEKICKKKGAVFLQHKFEGYRDQKNWARKQATYPYVLSLDADEALSDELKNEIQKLKEYGFQYDGYYFNRMTNYCGKWIKHSGWYPDRKLRLWNNNKAKWGGENIHERLELEANSKTKFLKGNLLHYSFYTIEQHVDTINQFSTKTAIARYKKGKKFSMGKALLSPSWKFFQSYVLKKGFLDGFYGFVICKNSAYSTFLKQVKLYQIWQQQKKNR